MSWKKKSWKNQILERKLLEYFITGMSKSCKLKEVLENVGTILENFGKVLENFGNFLENFGKFNHQLLNLLNKNGNFCLKRLLLGSHHLLIFSIRKIRVHNIYLRCFSALNQL